MCITSEKRMAKLLPMFCLVLVLCLMFTGCASKTITGNEWLLKQQTCFNDLEAYANGMDEVYALYFIESISKEDFVVELDLLQQQYQILSALYDDLKADNPIEPESHSFISKKGTEAIENIYACFGDILTSSLDENGQPLNPDQLAYQYLAFKQTLNGYIADYTTAVAWYKDSASTEEEK